jgi:hypothetical protein
MVNEDAALLNRRVTHMTPAALFNRRLHKARHSCQPAKNDAGRTGRLDRDPTSESQIEGNADCLKKFNAASTVRSA